MGTTAQKLQKILDTKAALKNAINERGGTITDDTPFDEYPIQVSGIPSSPSFTDPNVTFSYGYSSSKLYLEYAGTMDSLYDNKLFIYKHNVTIKYKDSSSSSTTNSTTSDIYVMFSMNSTNNVIKVTAMPSPNKRMVFCRPSGTHHNLTSDGGNSFSYLGLEFTSTSGVVTGATLNNSELLYVIDSNE